MIATLAAMALACSATALPQPPALSEAPSGASFKLLGLISPLHPSSWGMGISLDGAVIVGSSYTDARELVPVRWSAAGELTLLDHGGTNYGSAWGVSGDGQVIVGEIATHPALWRNGILTKLDGTLGFPWSTIGSAAVRVTPDGRTATGVSKPLGQMRATRWRDTIPEDLTLFPGPVVPLAAGGTDDTGEIVVGAAAGGGYRAFRLAGGVIEDLGALPGSSALENTAGEVSADGRRVVGRATPRSRMTIEGFLWSAPTAMVGLGAIPTANRFSVASAISRDGRVVGGACGAPALYVNRGVLWDAVHGMRALDDILDQHGVQRNGWETRSVTSIARDGTAFTGTAYDPTGSRSEAFLVTLPPWCWADCTGDDAVDFNDLLCFLNRFERAQDPRANPIDFFYCDFAADDTIDFNDFLAFLNLYNQGCPR